MTDSASPANSSDETSSPATSSDASATTPPCESAASDASSPSAVPEPNPVAWWTRPMTRWLALLVATAILLYLCWLMLEPFVDVLMWAAVLVIVFYPVHQRILARLGK